MKKWYHAYLAIPGTGGLCGKPRIGRAFVYGETLDELMDYYFYHSGVPKEVLDYDEKNQVYSFHGIPLVFDEIENIPEGQNGIIETRSDAVSSRNPFNPVLIENILYSTTCDAETLLQTLISHEKGDE